MSPIQRTILVAAPDEPGFRQYADELAAEARELNAGSWNAPLYFAPLDSAQAVDSLVDRLVASAPDLIHFHHEFGYMGSKTPGRYRFPELKRKLRERLPRAKLVVTAHTVIGRAYEYPWRNRGWQTPLRLAANLLLLPSLKRLWMEKSWGDVDGVIAHSSLQLQAIHDSGCKRAREIPHYVPDAPAVRGSVLPKGFREIPAGQAMLLVFGYLTPEKAQDIAIQAMAHLKTPAQLVLAGGIRREADRPYLERCEGLIRDLKLEDRVQITGYVSFDELDALVARADLVLLPFRETSGSGSLADLMTRRAPVLASDLPLNLEISRRCPGALAYFRSEAPADCASQADRLLGDRTALSALRKAAESYAELVSPRRIMQSHLDFYAEVLES